MSEFRDAALRYIARGWPVFPVRPRGKIPLTAHGFRDASALEPVVREWWRRWPDANVGIPTGRATFDVVDLDGEEGLRMLAALEDEHGRVPAGPRQLTGGGGMHILLVGGSLRTTARRLPGIDTRGDGGYIVAAPSIHSSGRRYAWEDEDEPIPECPWLVAELTGRGVGLPLGSPAAAAAEEEAPAQVPVAVPDDMARDLLVMAGIRLVAIESGARNDSLFRVGCSLRARGMDLPGIVRMLGLANLHLCRPPMTAQEVERCARSAASYAIAPEYQAAAEGIRALEERRERTAETLQSRQRRAVEQAERARVQAERAAARVATAEASVATALERTDEQIAAARERADQLASVAALDAADTDAAQRGDLETTRQLLAAETGVTIERVVQVGRDEAKYLLDLGDGDPVMIGPSILKKELFAEAMAKHRQSLSFALIPDKKWHIVLRMLMRLVEVRDDVESERAGQTRGWIADLVQDETLKGRLVRSADTIRRRLPFVDEGLLHLSVRSFAQHLTTVTGNRFSQNDVIVRLRELGFERRGTGGMVYATMESGAQVGARYWSAPLSAISHEPR